MKVVDGSTSGARAGRTGTVGQALAALGLTALTTAAFARGAGGRGGVSAGAGARPRGGPALRDAGGRALPPVGPARPEPVHRTNGVTDRGLRARAGAKLSAVFRGGLVTGPDGQLKPLPTGGGALPSRGPGPPSAVHCRTTQTAYSWSTGDQPYLPAGVPPGQLGRSLQPWRWSSSPGHLLPGGAVSAEGAGLEQERRRVLLGMLLPAMQDAEHSVQPSQADHPP